jgi:hypothetical protein
MGLEAQEVHHGGNEMNRRNFLKTAAAAVLGLVAGLKGRQEPVEQEPSSLIIVEGMSLDDLGPEAIATLEGILHTYGGLGLHPTKEPYAAFQGLDHLITTGYQECPSEFRVVRGDCGSA